MADQAQQSNKGRQKSGIAKTTTQRVNAMDAALKASGGRILSRLRLSANASNALKTLSSTGQTERSIIESSLISRAASTLTNGICGATQDNAQFKQEFETLYRECADKLKLYINFDLRSDGRYKEEAVFLAYELFCACKVN